MTFDAPIIEIVMNGSLIYQNQDPSLLRSNELAQFQITDPNTQETLAQVIINIAWQMNMDSKLGILRTLLVCILLVCITIKFSTDAEILIVDPIKNMLEKIQRITKDPMQAKFIEEEEYVHKMKMIKDGFA